MWSKDYPIKTGFYWITRCSVVHGNPEIVSIRKDSRGGICFILNGIEYSKEYAVGAFWQPVKSYKGKFPQ